MIRAKLIRAKVPPGFILAQILPPEAPAARDRASGGDI